MIKCIQCVTAAPECELKIFINKMHLIKKKEGKKRKLTEQKQKYKKNNKKKPAELLILSQGLKNRKSRECLVILR